jgi:hypothetical protein
MLSNRHFKRCFGDVRESAAAHSPLGRFAPAPNANRGEKAGQPLKTGWLNHATLWLHFFLAWANLQPGGCA